MAYSLPRTRHIGAPMVRASLQIVTCMVLGAQQAPAQDIKLNEVQHSLFYAPQYVALRIGAFEQEGLKIVGPKTTWGSQATITEVVSGNSNVALLGPEASTLTQGASPERRLVNFARLTDGDGSFIISKTQIANFKIADLKGKTIVTSGTGSTPSLTLVHLIKQGGLDPTKDVNIRYIPVSANIIPSYFEPNTQFAQAFEPAITLAVNEGRGYRVASVGALLGPMPYTSYASPASYIEKNPGVIQSFTNAIYKGLVWTDTHSAEQIAELVAPDFKEIPLATITTVIAEYKKVGIWAKDPTLSPEGINRMVGLMVEGGILRQPVPYDQIVKPEFAEKAIQNVKK
jgi:NitT/TauT family transport system substrate-binding protein